MDQWMSLMFIVYNFFWTWQGAKLLKRVVSTIYRVDKNANAALESDDDINPTNSMLNVPGNLEFQ